MAEGPSLSEGCRLEHKTLIKDVALDDGLLIHLTSYHPVTFWVHREGDEEEMDGLDTLDDVCGLGT